jgi:RNA polymerase sigma-70 factor (ECF subfamily)
MTPPPVELMSSAPPTGLTPPHSGSTSTRASGTSHSTHHLVDFPDETLVVQYRMAQLGANSAQAHAVAEELLRRYQNLVYGTVFRLVRNVEEAEDLTQEAFLRALQKLDSYDVSRPFKPWILRLACNLAISKLRSTKPQSSLEEEGVPEYPDPQNTPERVRQNLDHRQRVELIQEALRSQPAEIQAAFRLHYQEGLTLEEIAPMIQKQPGALRVALLRARTKIRTLLLGKAPDLFSTSEQGKDFSS